MTRDGWRPIIRAVGAPVTLSVDALERMPTERERRLARAFELQFENLAIDVPTALSMGDCVGRSGRQVQRNFDDFGRRYPLNAQSWRDARNRWRVENATLLLSRPELTVLQVAREVGYASPNALARALGQAGFPPPALLRKWLREMSETDPFRWADSLPEWRAMAMRTLLGLGTVLLLR